VADRSRRHGRVRQGRAEGACAEARNCAAAQGRDHEL